MREPFTIELWLGLRVVGVGGVTGGGGGFRGGGGGARVRVRVEEA